ncbi:MAG: hypothetical protein HY786_01185 [Deltaproteobacteria bacterium]|nr:hypothetical protein [Deltaproteobacteria bacterium]
MDGIEWKQYDPPEIAETVTRQDRRYNSASISVFVRSLMSKEWARALGKKPAKSKPGMEGLYGSR